jgi:energy-coupling factor transporter ATP-binding protein EcfA2
MPRHLIYTFAAMPHMPIQKVTIQNCGCVKKAEVNLTRLHTLIGPNDSGKSTILRALRTATQFATNGFTQDERGEELPVDFGTRTRTRTSTNAIQHGSGEILPFTPLLNEASGDALIGITLESSLDYQVASEAGKLFEFASQAGRPLLSDRQPRPLFGKSSLTKAELTANPLARRPVLLIAPRSTPWASCG